MATVRVTPEQFGYVDYDPSRIAAIAEKLAAEVGLATETIDIDIDDSTPLARASVESYDSPVRLHIEGGALEDPTAPRALSERATADVVGRLLLRVADRRSGRFDGAPADSELSLQQQVAWDAHCMGRLERLGYDVRQPRRRYAFRTRHGFSDVADAAFDRLWAADAVAWSDVDGACRETAAVRSVPASAS